MAGSTILIEYDGADITGDCLFSECSFESQMAAIPGQFTVVVQDKLQTHSFSTGKELTLTIDGQLLYGGYVLQATKKYAFPADNTHNPDATAVKSRQWMLVGVDWNILLDKRVIRNTGSTYNYTHYIPKVTGSHTDAWIIRTWFPTYFDIPAGFDFTSATYILDAFTFTDGFTWDTQGTKMRDVLAKLGYWGGVFWISADKQFHFLPVQDVVAPWGFSDVPNHQAYGATPKPLIGFRDGDFTEDASAIVNDAIVWGGSEWTVGGDIVYARRTNAASVTAHGTWQIGEVRLGDLKNQTQVTARAKVIVDGNESGVFISGSKGLVNPESQFRGTWFAHDVPKNGGVPVHLLPGQVAPIELWVFSADGGSTPFVVDLPLRQVTITFPGLDANGDAYVQFEGFFGVLMSDPFWMWDFLRTQAGARAAAGTSAGSANDSSVNPPYGSHYTGVPTRAGGLPPNGTDPVFYIPWGYIGGTLKVYLNGLLQVPTTVYTESDPFSGVFTFVTAPHSTDKVTAEATLIG